MPNDSLTVGSDVQTAFPKVREIGLADLKDALAKGLDGQGKHSMRHFTATGHVFLLWLVRTNRTLKTLTRVLRLWARNSSLK